MRLKNNLLLCIISLFLTFGSLYAYGQRGTLNYRVTVNDKSLGRKVEQNLILYFDKLASLELRVKPKNPAANIATTDLNQVKILKSEKPTFILKDFSKNKLLLSDYIGTKKVLIADTLNNFRWNISREKRKIGNLDCKKAETLFRGRLYEAWYTEAIPIRNGPWKFCGLPGLIVMLKDSKSDYLYELTGINLKAKFSDNVISLPIAYEKEKAITYKDFRTLYKKKLDDYIKLAKIEQMTPDGIVANVNIHLPEKQEKF